MYGAILCKKLRIIVLGLIRRKLEELPESACWTENKIAS